MHFMNHEKHTRRAFMRRSGYLAVAGTAAPFAMSLAAMSEAAAFNATDYKALVCVFLLGGNDYANTVVAYDDANYSKYSGIRATGAGSATGIVLPKVSLAETVLRPATALAQGRQYALHPSMGALSKLFNDGAAAVQLNVGPLVVPLTKAQYQSGNTIKYPLPPKLFSHNDQQSVWQSSSPEGSTIGWGGNIGDLALSGNSNSLFTCISLAGNSVFLAGDQALQYQCSAAGAVSAKVLKNSFFFEPAMRSAFAELIQQSSGHLLENEYNKVTRRAIAAEAQVSSSLGGVTLATPFPAGNSLASQLKVVAKMIGARNTLGNKRQVFMVQLGGFDLHDNLLAKQPALMQKVAEAMSAFYSATVELGVANSVTSFTASDFGRTLTSNGDGSDHGWGGHHFVVGGAVNGKAFYGTPPPISVGSSSSPDDQWHVGQGRLLPTASVDQYAATMAKWFGVASSELAGVLPNLRNFGEAGGRPDYPVDLGFLRAG